MQWNKSKQQFLSWPNVDVPEKEIINFFGLTWAKCLKSEVKSAGFARYWTLWSMLWIGSDWSVIAGTDSHSVSVCRNFLQQYKDIWELSQGVRGALRSPLDNLCVL